MAAVGEEGLPLAVGDDARGEPIGPQQDFVTGPFIVVRKALSAGADRHHATGKRGPGKCFRFLHRCRLVGRVGRAKGVLRKKMEDVGKDEFLMLLFMIKTELDQGSASLLPQRAFQEILHRLVDMGAVGKDVAQVWPGEQAPCGTRVACTFGLVIGIEEVAVLRMKGFVAFERAAKQEGFEEPRRMGEVPFCGTCVRHRLDGLVFRRQARGKGKASRTHVSITRVQVLALQGRRYLHGVFTPSMG